MVVVEFAGAEGVLAVLRDGSLLGKALGGGGEWELRPSRPIGYTTVVRKPTPIVAQRDRLSSPLTFRNNKLFFRQFGAEEEEEFASVEDLVAQREVTVGSIRLSVTPRTSVEVVDLQTGQWVENTDGKTLSTDSSNFADVVSLLVDIHVIRPGNYEWSMRFGERIVAMRGSADFSPCANGVLKECLRQMTAHTTTIRTNTACQGSSDTESTTTVACSGREGVTLNYSVDDILAVYLWEPSIITTVPIATSPFCDDTPVGDACLSKTLLPDGAVGFPTSVPPGGERMTTIISLLSKLFNNKEQIPSMTDDEIVRLIRFGHLFLHQNKGSLAHEPITDRPRRVDNHAEYLSLPGVVQPVPKASDVMQAVGFWLMNAIGLVVVFALLVFGMYHCSAMQDAWHEHDRLQSQLRSHQTAPTPLMGFAREDTLPSHLVLPPTSMPSSPGSMKSTHGISDELPPMVRLGSDEPEFGTGEHDEHDEEELLHLQNPEKTKAHHVEESSSSSSQRSPSPLTENVLRQHNGSRTFLNEYDILARIGSGRDGAVFSVKHKVTGGMYAIKCVILGCDVEKKKREAVLLSHLDHPNVSRYYHSWIESLTACEAMERNLIDDLDNLIDANFSVPETPNTSGGGFTFSSEESCSPASSPSSTIERRGSFKFNGATVAEEEATRFERHMLIARERNLSLDVLCIKMEYYEGGTLRDYMLLRAKAQLDLSSADWAEVNLKLLLGIAKGLQYLHMQDVMHRDLKPSNIFIGSAPKKEDTHHRSPLLMSAMKKCQLDDFLDAASLPVLKIGDFGRSVVASTVDVNEYFRSEEAVPHATYATEAFGQTFCFGTPPYASPEQLRGKRLSFATDIYSLGVIGVELFSNFTTTHERITAIEDAQRNAFPLHMSALPICPLLRSMLSPVPDNRPQIRSVACRLRELIIGLKDSQRVQVPRPVTKRTSPHPEGVPQFPSMSQIGSSSSVRSAAATL